MYPYDCPPIIIIGWPVMPTCTGDDV